MKRQSLDEVKKQLEKLDVAPEVIATITQAELDAIYADEQVPAYCHKCDSTHSIGKTQVLKYGLRTDSNGFVVTKCGRCYL